MPIHVFQYYTLRKFVLVVQNILLILCTRMSPFKNNNKSLLVITQYKLMRGAEKIMI